MTALLDEAIERLRRQPEDVQELAAQLLRDAMDGEAEWDRLFADPRSEAWLDREAAKVRAALAAGETTDFDPEDLPP